jgi:hypothetical protein
MIRDYTLHFDRHVTDAPGILQETTESTESRLEITLSVYSVSSRDGRPRHLTGDNRVNREPIRDYPLRLLCFLLFGILP